MRKKTNIKDKMFLILINVFLTFVFIITVYPFLYVLAVSLSSPQAVMQNKVFLYPIGINFNAYKVVLDNKAIWVGYKNTLLYTSVGTFVNLLLTSTMAYALSKKYLYCRRFFSFIVVFTMFFQGGLIPTYLLVNKLHMINTMWAVIFPYAISTWNLMIMRTFFMALPPELEEAAYIDGYNPVLVFMKIVLPLSKPIMVTMALFYAVTHWNSYFTPFIYLNDKSKFPLQITLQQVLIAGSSSFENSSNAVADPNLIISDTIKYATIIVSILPIIFIYPFLQKYFIKGMMVGSVKG